MIWFFWISSKSQCNSFLTLFLTNCSSLILLNWWISFGFIILFCGFFFFHLLLRIFSRNNFFFPNFSISLWFLSEKIYSSSHLRTARFIKLWNKLCDSSKSEVNCLTQLFNSLFVFHFCIWFGRFFFFTLILKSRFHSVVFRLWFRFIHNQQFHTVVLTPIPDSSKWKESIPQSRISTPIQKNLESVESILRTDSDVSWVSSKCRFLNSKSQFHTIVFARSVNSELSD